MTDQTGDEPKRTPEEQRILDEAEKKLEYDRLMKKRYARLFLGQALLEGGL